MKHMTAREATDVYWHANDDKYIFPSKSQWLAQVSNFIELGLLTPIKLDSKDRVHISMLTFTTFVDMYVVETSHASVNNPRVYHDYMTISKHHEWRISVPQGHEAHEYIKAHFVMDKLRNM